MIVSRFGSEGRRRRLFPSLLVFAFVQNSLRHIGVRLRSGVSPGGGVRLRNAGNLVGLRLMRDFGHETDWLCGARRLRLCGARRR